MRENAGDSDIVAAIDQNIKATGFLSLARFCRMRPDGCISN
jgi:hypothetical protein